MAPETFLYDVLAVLKKQGGPDFENLTQDEKASAVMFFAERAMNNFPEVREAVAHSVYEELRKEAC